MLKNSGLATEGLTKPQVTQISSQLEDTLTEIWRNKRSYIIFVAIAAMAFHLAQLNVAIAGSAIYAVKFVSAFWIDVVAFFVGIALLTYASNFWTKTYALQLAITIRMASMLPSTVIGAALLLLFHSGIPITGLANSILFVLSFLAVIAIVFSGVHHLLGKTREQAMLLTITIGMTDLLLGVIILLGNG